MIKRLRTASSPYLQPPHAAESGMEGVDLTNGGKEDGDRIGAIGLDKLKGRGNLLPLLPIPAKPGVKLLVNPITSFTEPQLQV